MSPRSLLRFALAAAAVVGVARRTRVRSLLLERGAVPTRDDWTLVAASPDGGRGYPPQGMAVLEDALAVTNHWNGRKSALYRVDPQTGEVLASAAMPAEARHTSGLAYDGEWLWALDHASNVLYRLDLAGTFGSGAATVDARFPTGLRGASGLALPTVDGREYVAVSDFVWTIETTPPLPLGSAKTYVAPLSAIEDGQPLRAAATVAYPNGGYSQGLTWDGERLYESLNNLGTDRIEVLDVTDALRNGRAAAVRWCGSFEGPAGRIEDLGTGGERLWTTDEGTCGLYRLDDLPAVRERATG